MSLRLKGRELSGDLSTRERMLGRREEELQQRREEFKEITLARKEQEIELDSKLAGIQKMEIQLFLLKTNKEYQALQKEIGFLKKACTATEDNILDLMERLEKVREEIAGGQKSVSVAEEEARKARENLDREKGYIEAETHRLEGKKMITASLMDDPPLIERYKKIISHYGSRAVVPVVDNICQGCFTNLPRHTVDEIRISRKPFFCENCSRILYLNDK